MALTADPSKDLVRRHAEGDDEGLHSVASQVAARATAVCRVEGPGVAAANRLVREADV